MKTGCDVSGGRDEVKVGVGTGEEVTDEEIAGGCTVLEEDESKGGGRVGAV